MEKFINKEQLRDNFKMLLALEWHGIRIENTKEEPSNFGFTKTIFYYSVPESSSIELNSNDKYLNDAIKTSDGLKRLAEEAMIDMCIDPIKQVDVGEFIDHIKNNISDYFEFHASIRNGEIWNEEMGDNRIKEIYEEIKNAKQYKKV